MVATGDALDRPGYDVRVLAADMALVDIDGAHWANWFDLLVPPVLRQDPRWAVLFLDGDRVVEALVHTPGAARSPDALAPVAPTAIEAARVPFTDTSAPALTRLCHALDVDAVAVLDRTVLDTIYHEIARNLAPSDDLLAQGIVMLRAFKRHHNRGIWSHPKVLDLAPPLSYEPLQRTFDLLVPDATSMVAYIMEDDGSDVHASLIAVKRDGHVELGATHLGIEDALAATRLAGDWRRGYKDVLALVAQRFAPASLGLFLERKTWFRIMTGPTDQLARELNARNVIIDPAPAWLLGLLGGATMAAFASRGAKVLARMLPHQARKMASGLAQTAQSVMRDSGAHPFALLGFDPIELWLELRHLYQQA